jgi:hypothetical protein
MTKAPVTSRNITARARMLANRPTPTPPLSATARWARVSDLEAACASTLSVANRPTRDTTALAQAVARATAKAIVA